MCALYLWCEVCGGGGRDLHCTCGARCVVVGGTCTVLVVPGVWWWEGLALACGARGVVGGTCTVLCGVRYSGGGRDLHCTCGRCVVVGGTCTVLVVQVWWEGLALYLWCEGLQCTCGVRYSGGGRQLEYTHSHCTCGARCVVRCVAVGGACTVFVV